MRAAAAAWVVLAAGVTGAGAIQLLAGDEIAARATALGLTAVLLGANAAGRRHPRWMAIADTEIGSKPFLKPTPGANRVRRGSGTPTIRLGVR